MRFEELDLGREILDAVEYAGLCDMTPIQEQTMPILLRGEDLIASAQTGTGKTAAFVLPIISRLQSGRRLKKESRKIEDDRVKALIIAPTRELAIQIDAQIQGFSYYTDLSTVVIHGGAEGKAYDAQRASLERGVDIVVATPGRLLAHIESGCVDLSAVEMLILDEADRLLSMGFCDDIMKITSCCSSTERSHRNRRQTALFSATLPANIRDLASEILSNPIEVSLDRDSIEQTAYIVKEEGEKFELLKKLLSDEKSGKTLIFASSKARVKDLAAKLQQQAMHSDLEQAEREQTILDFKSGKSKILVATDIIGRGVDIDDITLVINYDVPNDAEEYIHKIGRTCRAAKYGRAITLVNERERSKLSQIETTLAEHILER